MDIPFKLFKFETKCIFEIYFYLLISEKNIEKTDKVLINFGTILKDIKQNL